ncbi:WD repeat-containing protein WRAP73-like isoform X3 [Artemia franciscana]
MSVIALSANNVCLVVWCLINRAIIKLGTLKPVNSIFKFSPNGSWLSLTEVSSLGRHVIRVYSCSNWTLVQTIECEVTNISGLSWVDDGSIAYWDTLFSRKVCISLLCGTHIAKFENIPSLEKIDVSVSGGLIAMSNGKEIQIINVPTLRVLGKAPILQCIDDSVNIVVYREVLNLECVLQYETVNSRPYVVGKQKHEKEQLIHKMSFSYDGTFLSTVVSSSLSSVWIWDVKKVAPVCLITFINNVTDLKWCSTSNHLAVATGSDSIFIWSPTDSLSHSLEWTNQKAFPGKHLQWSDPGNLLLVYSKGCYKILSIFN